MRQLASAFSRPQRIGDQFPRHGVRSVALGEQLKVADDDCQVVEVMGDAAGELPQHLQSLRFAKVLLGRLALADIVVEGNHLAAGRR